jgi:hypothetical protein
MRDVEGKTERLWIADNNYNQQTPKNNLNLKFNPKNKPCQKNSIGKATTTTKEKTSNQNIFHYANCRRHFGRWA